MRMSGDVMRLTSEISCLSYLCVSSLGLWFLLALPTVKPVTNVFLAHILRMNMNDGHDEMCLPIIYA